MPPGPRTVPVQSAAPLPTEADCKKSVLLCLAMRCEPGRFARGVWTFSLCLAERDNDGSRGLEPTDAGEHTIRRRGATAERSNRTVTFNRRSATREQDIPCVRGLKSTATIMASLREATPDPSCGGRGSVQSRGRRFEPNQKPDSQNFHAALLLSSCKPPLGENSSPPP